MATTTVSLNTPAQGVDLFDSDTLLPRAGSYQNVQLDYDLQPRLLGKATKVRVQREVWHVLHRVLINRPTWTFRFTSYVGSTTEPILSAADFYCNGEFLGHLSVEYHRRQYRLAISNDRVALTRERGDTIYTADPNVAARTVLKMFYPRERVELIGKVLSTFTHLLSTAEHHAAYSVCVASNAFLDKANAFAKAHRQQYVEEMSMQSQEQALHKAETAAAALKHMAEAVKGLQSVLVILRPDDSALVVTNPHSSERTVEVMPQTALPGPVAARVGMLKMVPVGAALPVAGMHLSEREFVVYSDPL